MRIVRSTEAAFPHRAAPTAEGPETPASKRELGGVPFSQLLAGLGRELDRGEALAERAIHGGGAGGGMSPQALIALQAGIYRYSEAVDLVTKLVDRGTQAVKTTLQNQ